jgi:hypothetical protein
MAKRVVKRKPVKRAKTRERYPGERAGRPPQPIKPDSAPPYRNGPEDAMR